MQSFYQLSCSWWLCRFSFLGSLSGRNGLMRSNIIQLCMITQFCIIFKIHSLPDTTVNALSFQLIQEKLGWLALFISVSKISFIARLTARLTYRSLITWSFSEFSNISCSSIVASCQLVLARSFRRALTKAALSLFFRRITAFSLSLLLASSSRPRIVWGFLDRSLSCFRFLPGFAPGLGPGIPGFLVIICISQYKSQSQPHSQPHSLSFITLICFLEEANGRRRREKKRKG